MYMFTYEIALGRLVKKCVYLWCENASERKREQEKRRERQPDALTDFCATDAHGNLATSQHFQHFMSRLYKLLQRLLGNVSSALSTAIIIDPPELFTSHALAKHSHSCFLTQLSMNGEGWWFISLSFSPNDAICAFQRLRSFPLSTTMIRPRMIHILKVHSLRMIAFEGPKIRQNSWINR